MIVFAAIAPHGGLVFDQPDAPTRRGMEELGRRFTAARPEAAIVLTPHGLHIDDHFAAVRSSQLEGDAARWGALIPLWFMRAPAVVVTPCRARPNEEHVRSGAALARATGDRRIAVIASADHGHGHTEDGPYGFSAESAPYDALIQELVGDNRLGELTGVDPAWAIAAKADSFWQLLMLHGAIGDAFEAELLSYEAPTYFGMLTASFMRQD